MAESEKYQIAAIAAPQFIADQSDPDVKRYVFAYTITIENIGTVAAQLISRHWNHHRRQRTEAGSPRPWRGRATTVAQARSETFEYTNGYQLDTPVGTMRGSFQMMAQDDTQFEAEFAEFTLNIPRTLH